MSTNWRISSFNGALLAAYFIPTWTILSFKIMVLPIRSFFERPNVSVAFFASDYLHLTSIGMTRAAWMLALSRMVVVAFFAVFVMLLTRPNIRRSGGCDETLAVALGLGSLICFAMMVIASLVHEPEAMRLHATEFLMLIGTAIVMLVERPADAKVVQAVEAPAVDMPAALGEPRLLNR
jgi:hypothetical protein